MLRTHRGGTGSEPGLEERVHYETRHTRINCGLNPCICPFAAISVATIPLAASADGGNDLKVAANGLGWNDASEGTGAAPTSRSTVRCATSVILIRRRSLAYLGCPLGA